jgi:hypothetical protein
MITNPFRKYRERKRRERELALEHLRHLAELEEQRRRREEELEQGRRLEILEAQRRAKMKRRLVLLLAAVLIGGLICWHFGTLSGSRTRMPPSGQSRDVRVSSGPEHTGQPCESKVECSDGTMSCSLGSGTCSGHGGIKPNPRDDLTRNRPKVTGTLCADGTLSSSSGSGTSLIMEESAEGKHTRRQRHR